MGASHLSLSALLLQKLPGGCIGLGAWPSTCPCQGEVYAEAPQEGFYPLSQAVGEVVLETYSTPISEDVCQQLLSKPTNQSSSHDEIKSHREPMYAPPVQTVTYLL